MSEIHEFDEVSRALLVAADYLDERLIPVSGVVRRAARLLAQANVRQRATVEEFACPSCGGPMPASASRGRPRVFCSRRCRDAARYSRKTEG